MSKKIALAVWVLMLLLSMVLLFTLNQGMTAAFWITFVFVVAAFCSTLLFQCLVGKKAKTPDDRFPHFRRLCGGANPSVYCVFFVF